MSKSKINEGSKWLLEFVVEQLPHGYAPSNSLPPDRPLGLSMKTMRGLEKRGFVRESENGVFFATDEGVNFLKEEN